MALAKYFSKDLLAINRLINTKHSILIERLNNTIITIAFDANAVNTFEGCCSLDLITRLLSRLYPRLKIVDLSGTSEEKIKELTTIAKKINSNIELLDNDVDEDIIIIAGYTEKEIKTKGIIFHYGSENWISKYSMDNLQKFGESKNPFGSGIAASIVASNIFRYIFKDYLNLSPLDKEFEFSVYSLDSKNIENPLLKEVIFDDVVIAGIGAIGNGLIWALSNIADLKGKVHLVDSEKISLSNLQRYVLFDEYDENEVKVYIAKKFFKQKELNVYVTNGNWEDFVNNQSDWNIKCVAVGIDNEKDRIGIQSTLPHIIFNAFTETESVGITRHYDFIAEACLSCSHIPLKKKKDFINEVADNCNISNKSDLVKIYYNSKLPVNLPIPNMNVESLLAIIAKANGIQLKELAQFNGMTINQFYSDFVCGGVILKVSKTNTNITNVDAPLAFQSAIAGIFLAAELVRHHLNSQIKLEPRTDFYHLSPIEQGFNPLHRILEKDKTNRCICRDNDFINRYQEKWKN
jgi:hypothetical protein